MALFGVDISEHNGFIDFDQLKNNVDFVIIRSSWGSFAEDLRARRNASECERVGIPYGFYHYSYARNLSEAQAEVNAFLNFTGQFHPSMPLYIDMEDADGWKANNGGVSWETSTEICRLFCDHVEAAGYWAGVYASLYWFQNMGDLSRYTNWVAQWQVDACVVPTDIWQFTSDGLVGGIGGRVDSNYMYRDLRSVYTGQAPEPRPAVTPAPAAPSSSTYTVQAGDTLSGIAAFYGTSYQELAAINGIANPDLIYPGQVLQVTGSGAGTSERTYTVESGDTLSGIAALYGTSYQHLAEINGIENPDLIYPGQVLRID
ncbi:glycoside hydrolase, family 25 [Streptococcus sp. AS20]|uniref:LysM peptidoglycan-binding domain-containing protein n=1 Tax=Streptococcus sp. AS20 TaxID=936578 RepID=UPI00044885EF|nr:LysM peptidoglycan-binding domain-containing protein [Streptococcus sp. AS20]EUB25702.1 glycoside hydrolase, family 25 [Streptococcus sp. AS20]